MAPKTATVMLACLLVVAGSVYAEEPAEPLWSGETGFSFVATSGNSDTQTIGLNAKLVRRPDPWGLELSTGWIRAEQEGETTAERLTAHSRAERKLADKWSLFGGLSAEQDKFAGYDLRAIAEAGATYQLLVRPRHKLGVDGGLTWTDEDLIMTTIEGEETSESRSFAGGVLGISYEWKISETASLSERLVWFPNFEESGNWRGTSKTTVKAALTSRLALNLGYELRYQNEPVPGFEDTDTTTTASLVLSF